VNIKKGQFMSPDDMQYAMEKVTHEKNKKVFVTERGTSFGYHNLVVDMRGLAIMRKKSPVIFDLTHSVQIPGGLKGKSGGAKEFAPVLGRAAAAAGVDGFFIETHPAPERALSDGPNMIPLKDMEKLVTQLLEVWSLVKNKKFVS
jgi:2-dehydro-3-deoxyphosphooctonate aldolase (KDO 8-P synthase)